mgnify:CR=1 FL=1
MANTFKLKTKAGVTSLATVYTVPSNTTALIIGGYVGNTTTSGISATVTVSSDTSDTETNADVEIITNAPIPVGGTIQPFGSGKQVLQTTDIVKVSATGAVDVSLSILEITPWLILVYLHLTHLLNQQAKHLLAMVVQLLLHCRQELHHQKI